MRIPSDMPSPRPRRPKGEGGSNRRRILIVVALVILFFFFTSLRGIAGFYTDYLWFDSLGYDDVFTGVLGAKIALAVIFTAVFFAVCLLNLVLADRMAPEVPPDGPEQEVFDRITETIGKRTGLVRAAIAFVLALVTGVGMSQEWQSWLLFTNGGEWGQADAQFDRDIGFYVFDLPFLSAVADWAFASMLVILVATLAAHFVNGGIRMQSVTPGSTRVGPTVTSQVKAHISVLLGVLALIRAGGYYLERFELTTSGLGFVDGAGYTDVNARLPVLYLLILISITAFVLFIVNIRRRGWVLPVLAVGLWGLVAVIASGIYPQVIQRFQVDPNELSTELPYIERNIAATREAIGMADMQTVDYTPEEEAGPVDLSDNQETISNVRLWDPGPDFLGQTYSRLEQLLPYYALNDVDVDRYVIDGKLSQVMVSARDLNTGGVPSSSWEARHATYTHGYGLVMASATSKTLVGRPDFDLQQVPVQEHSDLSLDRPQLYFGEGLNSYVVTNTGRDEIDYETGSETETIVYDGDDGVDIGSLVNRVAFSLRFGDYNPLISSLITGDSQIHYIRDVSERVSTLAPFLRYDSDPYPVVDDDGQVHWILDAYTTTDRYPYGEVIDNSGLEAGSGLDGDFNYVRNSVKAVVDAYDGSVSLYVVNDDDPIVNAWRSAFPNLFSDFDEMPADLQDNVRYPEDLFRVQTNMWSDYHVSNPTTFYNGNDAWNVALDPADQVDTTTQRVDTEGNPIGPPVGDRVDPYYLLTELPGEEGAEFVMLRSFVPVGNDGVQLLTSFMVARSDPEHYGELITYEMPRQDRPDGPALVGDSIQSDGVVSDLQTQLGQRGSEVLLGNVILVPVDNALVWVRPFYVKSDGVQVPELEKVIVSFEGDVAVGDTLEEALGQIFDELPEVEELVPESGEDAVDPSEVEGETPDDEGDDGAAEDETVNEQAARLLEEANALYGEANTALEAGDLGDYQAKNEEAEAKVSEALDLLAPTTSTTTTSTTVVEEET